MVRLLDGLDLPRDLKDLTLGQLQQVAGNQGGDHRHCFKDRRPLGFQPWSSGACLGYSYCA